MKHDKLVLAQGLIRPTEMRDLLEEFGQNGDRNISRLLHGDECPSDLDQFLVV